MMEPRIYGTVPGKLYLAVKGGDLEAVNAILQSATTDEVNQREGNQVGTLKLYNTPFWRVIYSYTNLFPE